MPRAATKPKLEVVEKPTKIAIGYTPDKPDGFTVVDTFKHEKVDKVFDPLKKWEWADNSVDEVICVNFIHRLTNDGRVHFFNELFRVLKEGKQARVVTPHWSHEKAYGDLDVQWPPVTAFTYFHTTKQWREMNAPHVTKLKCDFDWVLAGSHDANDEWVTFRSQEVKQVFMHRNINTTTDLIATLTKRPKE